MTSYITENKKTSENITPDNRSHNSSTNESGKVKNKGVGANNESLIDGLKLIPDHWALTPVVGKKAYRNGWQEETPPTKATIEKEIEHKATGYGLRTGEISGGLIAIDIDGSSADQLLKLICDNPPTTVAWTSGKEGRSQLLFKVPDQYREQFQVFNKKVVKQWGDYRCNEKEHLEIRYNNHYSVLPPSLHPETGQYEWIIAPDEMDEMELAPDWLIKLVLDEIEPPRTPRPTTTKTKQPPTTRWERHLAQFPYSDEVPLEKCLSKANQELLGSGAGEGARNDKGAELAYDAVATARFLEDKGQPYSGSVEDIIADYCDRCTPPLSAKECRNLEKMAWKHAKPSKREDYIPSQVASYFWIPDPPMPTDSTISDSEDKEDKPKKLSTAKLLQFVEQNYSLTFNEITREVELNKAPLECEPYLLLAQDHNIETGKDKAYDIFALIAKKHSYNPVKQELEQLSSMVNPIDISNLSTRYFGTNNPLYDVFVKKMLIGAVARIYEPGCKLDTALVLQGKQGIGKSSFFDVIGGDYFDDSMGNGSDKDDLLTLHRSWVQEWGELDRIFGKKAVGEVKQFLSKRKDLFRQPYGRKAEIYYRHSIIVGSVNDATFLTDPTGDRRFWVVPVQDKINIPLLKQERQAILSAAVSAYKAGETWWLNEQEQLASNANNSQFRERDEWEDLIEDYLSDKTQVTTGEILKNGLNFDSKDMNKGSQMRVGKCLEALGWEHKKISIDGKRKWGFIKPSNLSSLGNEVGQAGTTENTTSVQPVQPVQPVLKDSAKDETMIENSNNPPPYPNNAQEVGAVGQTPTTTECQPDNTPTQEVGQVGHSWYHREGMKPHGTETDLPLKEIEALVTDYLIQHGETEEFELIAAIGQKTPAVRTALDNIGAKRRRVNGQSSFDYMIYWSLT